MQDLTRGPVAAHLRRQAIPFSLGLGAIFSFEAVDLFSISRLGDAPLAAISFTFPVIWLVYGIGMGFEAGAASCISRAIEPDFCLLAQPLSTLFSHSESIQRVAVHYLWLVSWAYGAHGLVMSCNAAFNGSGRPLPAVLISTARLIFLFLPLALLGQWLMGLEGIFAATSISNLLLAGLAFGWLGRHITSHGAADQPRPPQAHGTFQVPDQKEVRKETPLPP